MNDPTLTGPCADYEHDLVELHDGALPPERAHAVRLHAAQCPRCRAWTTEFARLDAQLAAVLPRPVLSSDFEARLKARLESAAHAARRDELRAALVQEHDSLLATLQRSARRRAVLGAVAASAAAACAVILGREVLVDGMPLVHALAGGSVRWLAVGLSTAVAVAALSSPIARGVRSN